MPHDKEPIRPERMLSDVLDLRSPTVKKSNLVVVSYSACFVLTIIFHNSSCMFEAPFGLVDVS